MRFSSVFAILIFVYSSVVFGTEYTGSVSGTTDWSSIQWDQQGTPGAGDSVALTVTGALTLNFDAATTLQNLSFTGNYGMTLSGSALNVSGLSFSNGNKGTVTISAPINATSHFTIAAVGDTSDSGGSNTSSTALSNAANTFADGIEITSGLITSGNFGGSSTPITLNGGGFQNRSIVNPLFIGPNGGVFRVYGGLTQSITSSISDADSANPGVFRKTDGGTANFTCNLTNFTGTIQTARGTANFNENSLNNFPGTLENKESTFILTNSDVDLSKTTLSNIQGTLTFAGNVDPTAFKAVNYTKGTLTFGNGDAKTFTGDFTWGEPSSKTIEVVNFNYTNDCTVKAPTLKATTMNIQKGTVTLSALSSLSTLNVEAGTAVTDARTPSSAQSISTVNLSAATSTLNIQGGNSNSRISNVNAGSGTVNFLNGSQSQITGLLNSQGNVNFKSGSKGSVNYLITNSESAVSFENGSNPTISVLKSNGSLTIESGAAPKIANLQVVNGTFADNQGVTVNSLILGSDVKPTGTAATKVSSTLEVGNARMQVSGANTLSVSAPASGSTATRAITLNEGTLTLSASISGLAARFDASDPNNFITNESGSITTWKDSSGNGNNAVQMSNRTGTTTLTTDAALRKEVVVFPDGSSEANSSVYQFNRISDIQTVVWVLKDQSNVNPSLEGNNNYNGRILLGDTGSYNFHRGLANSTAGGTDKQYPVFNTAHAAEGVRNGTIMIDGNAATASTTLSTTDWSLVSLQLKEGTVASANVLSQDRGMWQRSWNGSVAEVLIFNRRLTDEETLNLNAYLNDKWNLNKTALNGVEYTDPFTSPIDLTDTDLIVSGSAAIQSEAGSIALGNVTVLENASLNLDLPTETSLSIATLRGSGTVQADSGLKLSGTNVQVEIGESGVTELKMNADVDLSGSVFSVEFIDGFQPEIGDSYQIMQAKHFMNLEEATLNAVGLTIPSVFMAWDITDLGNGNFALTLTTSVPEPATIVLLILGMGGLGLCFRKNDQSRFINNKL